MSVFRQYRTQLSLAKASLLNAPAFSLAVITTLSLTLTALFVVLSIINVYFFKPLPVQDEDRLTVVELETSYANETSAGFQSYPALTHLYNNQNSFERQFMTNTDEFVALSLPGEPKLNSIYATGEYFKILKMPLVLGSYLPEDLELNKSSDGVLISERLWHQYFNGQDDVIGQTISTIEDLSFTVMGVVSKDFKAPFMFKESSGDLWFPMTSDFRHFGGRRTQPWSQYFRFLKVIGVRKQGITNADVKADLDQQLMNIEAEWRAGEEKLTALKTQILNFRSAELGDKDHLSLFMLAGTLALVLIALVNVSNLFFSRAVAQHRNLALQAVLGARRKTLFNALFMQTLLLVTVSVLTALFLSAWGIKLFKYLALGKLPLVHSVSVDLTLVVVSIFITFVLAYLFSWLNAKLINYQALNTQIQASGKGNTRQISGRTVKILIGLQMLLASLVVIGSQMALSKSMETINKPLGSKVENLYNVVGFIPGIHSEVNYSEAVDMRNELIEVLRKHPDIASIAQGESPVQKQQFRQAITNMEGETMPFIPGIWVGPDYFDLTGVKILEGRTFSDAALRFEKRELLVSKSAADMISPNENIIGRQYEGLGNQIYEVVGVTEDFHHPLYDEQDQGRRFWWSTFPYSMSLLIEMKPGKVLTKEKALEMYRQVYPRVSIWRFFDLTEEYKGLLFLDTVTFWVCIALAVFTLFLAGVGIYGVLTYNLEARRFEFGIKMAVGAKLGHLYKLLLKETIWPLLLGVVAALAITLVTYLSLQDELAKWLNLDILFVCSAIGFTLLVAIFSSVRPMRKVIKSEPMKALRNE